LDRLVININGNDLPPPPREPPKYEIPDRGNWEQYEESIAEKYAIMEVEFAALQQQNRALAEWYDQVKQKIDYVCDIIEELKSKVCVLERKCYENISREQDDKQVYKIRNNGSGLRHLQREGDKNDSDL